jgi:hypothetical protein
MWEAIPYVSSAITLVAFIGAVAVFAYRSSLKRQEKLIKTAPDHDRVKMAEQILERFQVDTEGLTKAQRYDIAMAQIRNRLLLATIGAIIVAVIAILASIVLIVALTKGTSGGTGEVAPKAGENNTDPSIATLIHAVDTNAQSVTTLLALYEAKDKEAKEKDAQITQMKDEQARMASQLKQQQIDIERLQRRSAESRARVKSYVLKIQQAGAHAEAHALRRDLALEKERARSIESELSEKLQTREKLREGLATLETKSATLMRDVQELSKKNAPARSEISSATARLKIAVDEVSRDAVLTQEQDTIVANARKAIAEATALK